MKSTATRPSRKRPRYIEGSVQNLVQDILIASSSAQAASPQPRQEQPSVVITDEAMEALVACHFAFLAEISESLTLSSTSTEDYKEDRSNNDDRDAPATKKVTTTNQQVRDLLERHCSSQDGMNCADLWGQAVDMVSPTSKKNNTDENDPTTETKQKKKRKRKQQQNALLNNPDLLAEQERLLEASRQKALMAAASASPHDPQGGS